MCEHIVQQIQNVYFVIRSPAFLLQLHPSLCEVTVFPFLCQHILLRDARALAQKLKKTVQDSARQCKTNNTLAFQYSAVFAPEWT